MGKALNATVEAVATAVATVPPGGAWEPPDGPFDVGVLVPLTATNISELAIKTGLPIHAFDGLDGEYILSSDGSTRPAKALQ